MSQPTSSTINYGFGVTLQLPFAEVVSRVTEALKAEGFGILTTIDVQATMKTKLDVDYAPYTILGACNPTLAHRAITIEPTVGLLLPCNVVIREVPEGMRVDIVDPDAMLGIVRNEAMMAVAAEARAKLQRVAASLQVAPHV